MWQPPIISTQEGIMPPQAVYRSFLTQGKVKILRFVDCGWSELAERTNWTESYKYLVCTKFTAGHCSARIPESDNGQTIKPTFNTIRQISTSTNNTDLMASNIQIKTFF